MIAADICRNALIQGGIITLSQTIFAEDMLKAFDQLNSMIGQWNRNKFNLYNEIDVFALSTGASTYTIGAGMQFDTPRPDQIMAAYTRILPVHNNSPVDIPLHIIISHEDWASMVLKNVGGFPVAVWLDTSFPTALLSVWPVPVAGLFEIHIVLKDQLTAFPLLTTPVSMPAEYIDAMTYQLAMRLRPGYKLGPDQTVTGMANAAMNTVKGGNAQVTILKTPSYGPRRGGGQAFFNTGGMS